MREQSGVLGYSYDVVKILVLLAVYVVVLTVGTLATTVARQLHRIRAAGSRLVGRSQSRPKTSSRP
ncbi:hypothetical protein ACOZ4N_11210 [Halorientalis pallida]|uniref:hypothetical protein n=1 Tax=Halorientalis pallida TaxID=2479928 RepID=UPI003C6FA6E1